MQTKPWKMYCPCNFLIFSCQGQKEGVEVKVDPSDAISVYSENPFYWQYKGSPVLLVGGSREDNLFNHPEGLESHLDDLKRSGGNYIRNTMRSRNPGNPWVFKKGGNGLYDLEEWDVEFWDRFQNLLQLCHERDIIVQVEIWDPWDYFKSEASLGYGPENVGWESCPFNPVLNTNYTAEETELDSEIDYFSKSTPSDHLFFSSIPELKHIPEVLKYQEAYVDKPLSYSLPYPNVLYCMNNEIGEAPEWGQYWARYVRKRATEAGKKVFLADMRRNTDFSSQEQLNLLFDRDHLDFFEISQNNANNGQHHYDQLISIRDQVISNPRPLNNVKIYGGEIGKWTTSVEEGTRRFCRSVFGCSASVRFHRPGPSYQFFGLGLSDLAKTHIRSMKMFTEELDIFRSEPSNGLLSSLSSNEVYCLAQIGDQYALYFPDGGSATLDLGNVTERFVIKWLNILESSWEHEYLLDTGTEQEIKAPGMGQRLAMLKKQ